MSEMINNTEIRQQALKTLILKLHDGVSLEQVKAEFIEQFSSVTAIEITALEQALVDDGMPVEDIQRLCDVHAEVFKGSIEEIHSEDEQRMASLDDLHPINKLKLENRSIETLVNFLVKPSLEALKKADSESERQKLLKGLKQLSILEKHYSKKENLIFPIMEKHDITAPPKVMWGVDDEVRSGIKGLIKSLENEANELTVEQLIQETDTLLHHINEMIFKEEKIMMPMVLEKFTEEEWLAIDEGCFDIGFMVRETLHKWEPTINIAASDVDLLGAEGERRLNQSAEGASINARIAFDAGSLLPEEINAILNTLPLDMTFVGADDRVKYFTQGKERIFDRPKTIIGREVKNCHPPKSVHIVEKIVEDLKSGKKDHEDFWIQFGDKFVYIRYFAVRNAKGEFLGTLEITQDIKPIQSLEGEKRLMSE